MVYISGAVNKAGVFKVNHNARVIDVVNMAGGLTMEADGEKINMAQLLKDGMHIHVTYKSVSSPSNGGNVPVNSSSSSSSSSKWGGGNVININTADKSALDTLPGVGPALAERIIEYRQTKGSFNEIEDFKKVPGIGDSKFEKLKDKITI